MTSAPPYALARFRQPDGRIDPAYVSGEVLGNAPASLGLVVGDHIRPLTAEELGAPSLNDFLAAPDWQRLEHLAEAVPPDPSSAAATGSWRPLDSVVLTAPVEPRQVLQTGANYREHVIELVASGLTNNAGFSPENAKERAAEMMDDRAANGEPYIFIGLPACVAGPEDSLVLPDTSDTHDWELELAAVIGRPAYRVSREEALDHVAGFTICNDVSTREFTFRKDMKDIGSDWFRSKNSPGFLPTGPFLVPAPFIDPTRAHLRLALNGEVKQDASTADLMFDLAALLSAASQTARLLPGDLLLTGSPAGNGQYWKRFLEDGDVLEGTISGLGTQVIRCTSEEPTTRSSGGANR
ncbi:fumarylacetoacetate hydrolase family protein [Brevibacterium permense]|uniref:fumarylacetoacetate hydrolase family protein n=1 Tax=Brevibacterium permense TaxID=234834 RepID=UPI0021CE1D8B|nr:fumarylacetoacetate hydrolase family protein [Brevibacterium permense]MCU4298236.1 fumarylacetoacetate hydrolase family protein [Brevibacterium permense]